jgi:hypothetical protein
MTLVIPSRSGEGGGDEDQVHLTFVRLRLSSHSSRSTDTLSEVSRRNVELSLSSEDMPSGNESLSMSAP